MQWRLIDGIGPFFGPVRQRRINWSKVPFAALEHEGELSAATVTAITADFKTFVTRAAAIGFNAVTLDDLAHLMPVPAYAPALARKIEQYREWYRSLIAIAAQAGLAVFITTDIMFYNDTLHRLLRRKWSRIPPFLAAAIDELFHDYPGVAGVVTRIGEADGVDVKGDFRSELVVRTPGQVRQLLRTLLPVFARHHRTLIFRTWSVGAYAVGDLMWNRTTCARAFDGLDHSALIVSHKYGESDFFRYMPLNKQFFRGTYRKLIELQARREYEGFGEFPSFIGWDYDNYARQLRNRSDLAGFSIWCQTGGWSSFRRRTLLEPAGLWNEINTVVAHDLFAHGWSVEQSVRAYAEQYWPQIPVDRLLVFLRLSDEVIKELLYIDEFSQRKLFFRRVRVPPLLWVYWDQIIINHSLRKMLRCFVTDGEAKVQQGRLALAKIAEMQTMAADWGWPMRDLQFQYDTFEILAAARVYYFSIFHQGVVARLRHLKRRYRKRYRSRYIILMNFEPVTLSRRRFKNILALGLREQRGYRFADHILTIRLLAWFYPLWRRFSRNRLPDFTDQQAMGIDTLFR